MEEVVVDPDSSEAMRQLVEQGTWDFPTDRDLLDDPVTVDDVMTVIDRRTKRLMAERPHPVYESLVR